MTTDAVLGGLTLILVLAVACQVLASLLRIPALILLLPAGFTAGALTDEVDPDALLGPAFAPMVSLSVAVILFESGLGLDLRRLRGSTRSVLVRLIGLGVPITWGLGALSASLLLGSSASAAVMIGAILVVSGPTVVGPLLTFVRPVDRLQHLLTWEGTLIDPVGGILGALVFHGVVANHTSGGDAHPATRFLGSVGIGLAGGVAGLAVLWLLMRVLHLSEVLVTLGTVASVIGVATACDLVRDDTGLISAIVMGVGLGNLPGFDVASRRPFFETVVQLVLGLLFVSISATVSPHAVMDVLVPTLGVVAVLVLLARPLVAWLSTVRTDLSRGERAFVGWMAPRGIVAASTAATFAPTLTADGIAGASDILPATFLVIVATVTLYGLTAEPVARLLHVTRPTRTRPLLVGGEPWVVDLAKALRAAGLEVLAWAGQDSQREAIRAAGLEVLPGRLLAAGTGRGGRLEGITAVLLLTAEDDFNALAATLLPGAVDGPVHRVAPPRRSHGVVAPYTGGETLFGEALTRSVISRRHGAGAEIVVLRSDDGSCPPGSDLLVVVRADGLLVPVTESTPHAPEPGDTLVLIGPAPGGTEAAGDPVSHPDPGGR